MRGEMMDELEQLRLENAKLKTIIHDAVDALGLKQKQEGAAIWMDYIDPDCTIGGWVVDEFVTWPPSNSVRSTGLYHALKGLVDADQASRK